jgi:hypothetical protein
MENVNFIEIVFDMWKASLKTRGLKREQVRPNFEDLFQKCKDAGATFNDLYEDLLPRAVKAHQPSAPVSRATYQNLKGKIPKWDKTEKEFTEEWHKSIQDCATEVFFEYFKPPLFDQDDDPKVYGSMSEKEYKAQRKYVDQFPMIRTDDLFKKWQQEKDEYNNEEEIIENVLGDTDEVKS